ncbi:MAG: DUF120 domain-containing protein [Methanobrevibacter wolinii]|uniref:DUF120 domain-containing protein n=1 Tax=Methanobrevibacter wolinii TaxID=190977 RepID=UPI0005B2B802|nr:DUF120 domain-containing protein [Methanobrevibacter wolinii]MDD5960151.1 DUF120 domain-containing protein [Methanobrevibacter wolinii]
MEINGTVTSGFGKAAYFLGQDFYKSQFKVKCGFIPYPGTLNLTVPEKDLDKINNIKNNCRNVIKSDQGFGGVKYIKAKLENSVTGAIVFPDKTTHEENYLEFIAKDNLRKKLHLKDGNKVSLEINI